MNKPVVLIADDEKGVRSTISNFLKERYDCEFAEAKDGEEAVNFVKHHPCDVMILDIKMPKKCGITVIKETKDINPNIGILVISAWISDDVSREAVEAGAIDYMVKPVDLRVISMKFSDALLKKGYNVSKILDSV
ncbi:MAG: response regulator [Candidatus Omnitrophota bacterium]|nr:response regulator [Candidatus Omnitrophota bacterium]